MSNVGAFYPGVPVQPVCIKYPNRLVSIIFSHDYILIRDAYAYAYVSRHEMGPFG